MVNMTIDLNTILVLSGLAINLYFVIDRNVKHERRMSRIERWIELVERHFLPASKNDV